jgi:hypothetical protein
MALFDFLRAKKDTNNLTEKEISRPFVKNLSYDLVANKALTSGLYHGKYPGLKLASALAFPMIATPVYFMGFPSFSVEDEKAEEEISALTKRFITTMQKIHTESHREGTAWVWPKFSGGALRWEIIDDPSVMDIITSMDTGEIIAIYTEEQLKVRTGYNRTVEIRRRRYFTEDVVKVEHIGGYIPADMRDYTARNIGGLPIPFVNNADSDEIRGHSDYSRVLTDLKNYHDVDYEKISALVRFSAKQVQKVKNVGEWLTNNGFSGPDNFAEEYDLNITDIVLNVDGEETDFIIPDRVIDGYEKAQKTIFRKIVEGSGCPEIVWGVKTEGNANTAEEQMTTLIQYVQDKRRQKDYSYVQLMKASLRILSVARNANYQYDDLEIEWNKLDSVSDKIKSEIFANFTRGLATIIDKAGITKKQIYALWDMNFPTATEQDFEEWADGIGQAVVHRVSLNSDFGTVQDSAGLLGEEPSFQGDE